VGPLCDDENEAGRRPGTESCQVTSDTGH
jgi:hypothetical protein